jgi:hypothetical protein
MPSSGHHLPDVGDQPLRDHREAVVVGPRADALEDFAAQLVERTVGPQRPRQPVGQRRQRRPDITQQLGMREEHFLDVGRRISHVKHLRPFRSHQERRLLDRVVADRDDQVSAIDRPMHVVAFRQRRGAHVQLRAAGDRALSHLRVEERNPDTLHEVRQLLHQPRTVSGPADHDQRPLRLEDHLRRTLDRIRGCNRHRHRMFGHRREIA